MRVACLIQGDSWVALKNLLASHNCASIVTANLADQNVSPKIGDASLVIDGEEFVAHVVAHTESRIIFEADRFDEIAEKLSSSTGAGEGPVKTVVSAAGSRNDFHRHQLKNNEPVAYEHHNALIQSRASDRR